MSLLYHYCSVQAFHSISQSQSIHLSSLTLSNDSQEGKLVAKTIARLAKTDGLESPVSPLLKVTDDICLLRSSTDRLIPYRKFELANLGTPSIKKVILGPKNKTPCFVVKNFLQRNGVSNVEVLESEASYR